MNQPLNGLTVEELKKHLTYNPETGSFTWNKNGKQAGGKNELGYVCLILSRRKYRCHRLAWFYSFGVWPDGEIDHINRNKSDNRICNLRIIGHSENAQNKIAQSNSKSGIKGVFWQRDIRRWKVIVRVSRKTVHNRSFVFLHDAIFDSIEAYKKYHEFNPYTEGNNGADSPV